MDPKALPAFPTTEQHGFNSGMPGMTLRDYFAAQALPAILAQSDDGISARAPTGKFSDGTSVAAWWAQTAYQIADAMVAESTK